ncbi:MAG: hypothetical protein ACJAZ1_001080 [Yoonia sp.]|jgi:hypothetical protein
MERLSNLFPAAPSHFHRGLDLLRHHGLRCIRRTVLNKKVQSVPLLCASAAHKNS